MKALIYPDFGKLAYGDWPEPILAPDEVLVRVAACGICGSEMGGFVARSPRRVPPIVMGHEFSGVIEELGADVTDLTEGQRVVGNALYHCGECDLCRRELTHLCRNRQVFGMHRDGAFAELVNVPASIIYRIPDHVTDVQAAMVEPLGNGLHVIDLAQGNTLETVLVCGAGTIGLMCMQAARIRGAKRVAVSDTNPHRLEIAQGLGADLVINAAEQNVVEAMLEWTDGQGVELGVDAVGAAPTRRDAIQAARPGGDAVWIGLHQDELTLDTYEVVLAEKRILGSYAATDANMREGLQLFADGKIELEPWTQVFPLEQGEEVFLAMLEQKKDAIKAVLAP